MKNHFTCKQRLLNAILGKEIDHTPWSPFLAYYWESLPPDVQKKGQLSYLQQLGADPILRGSHQLFETRFTNCNIFESCKNNQKCIRYETPAGSLEEIYTFTPDSNSWFLTGHPVESEEDFKILQYIYEHITLQETISAFEDDFRSVGDDALLLPLLGTCSKTSFQSLVERWCGTENLIYALYDFESTVQECLDVMAEKDLETAEISVKSSAEAFLFYEDSSTTNISPALFEKYTLPCINAWGSLLHNNGKLLIHHACGHIRDLLPLMNKSEIDMIESISPPPTGNIDIPEALLSLSRDKGLIGGIEPTFLLSCSLEDLEERVEFLLKCAENRRFILANSDSCPPGTEEKKFLLISRLVQ